jgi:hypothetical protein
MIKLDVKVINTENNKELILENSKIFLDDSIKKIKEKLFIFDASYVPNFLKIQVNKSNNVITNSNDILYEYHDDLYSECVIYISNVQSIINNLNVESLLENSDLFETVLLDLNKDYIDLTNEDLQFLIKLTLLNKEYNIIQVQYSDIEDYVNNLKHERNKLIKKMQIMDKDVTINQFNKISKEYEFNVPSITYTDINLNIIGDNYESGSKGIFIKLNEIFNIIELNDNIPFIGLGKKSGSGRLPQIKIYNKLINIVQDKEIKGWVLNEKKKLNEASYKIIKGLMIKTHFGINNFLTINIMANGLIYVNLKLIQSEQEQYNILDELISDIKNKVNEIILYLNTFNGVFLKSKRLSILENSTITIDSLDSSIETAIFIDRIKFESIIKNKFISENILELKRTESLDILSVYYKKFKTREFSEDIKGITINIRDNPYKEDSSIIKIFGADNNNQTLLILLNIMLVNEMSLLLKSNGLFNDFIKKRKIREKTNKKKLKEQGVDFDSRECQAIRQPLLHTGSKLPLKNDSYIIKHNNKDYRCDNDNYPYPGFTKSNIVCCFKYNQTGNESYIKNANPDSLTILVEPSNFKINIKKNKKNFETYVIRIVSDYQDGFDELNSVPRYYYLTSTSDNTPDTYLGQPNLVPIYNKELIQDIENNDNIWLDRVPLSQIIYPSATNKCSQKPNLNNRDYINHPCAEYKKEYGYFGYTSKSIPCCFDKEKEAFVNRKKKESDITKQYIIQSSDKILNYQKIGILPRDISILFNKILNDDKDETNKFYRMGIIQNNNSFLNAVLLGVNNVVRQTTINNHIEFKHLIIQYLEKNSGEFSKLNNGDISNKYTLKEYINYINDNETYLHWNDFIDLLERLLKRNIIIFDINESESKLLCRRIDNSKKFNGPFLILLKKKNTFELLLQLILNSDKKNDMIKEFEYNNKIIKFLTEYYKDTCIKENIYPTNYTYIPIKSHIFIIEKFNINSKIGTIKYQIKNNFNKINLLMTSRGIIIPILETGIIDNPDIKIIAFSSLINQSNKLLSLSNYTNTFKEYNQITKDNLTIIGITDSNITDIGGLMTSFGTLIPYLKNVNDDTSINKLDFKYYLDIDEKLNMSNNDSIKNNFQQYSENDDNFKILIFNLKTLIGNEIYKSTDIKDDLENIIKNTSITKNDKINYILKTFLKFNTIKQQLKKHDFKDNIITFLKSIANDMINDNKENLILNNIITSDTFNKNDIIIRNSESILLNIDDIRKWIKNYKTII